MHYFFNNPNWSAIGGVNFFCHWIKDKALFNSLPTSGAFFPCKFQCYVEWKDLCYWYLCGLWTRKPLILFMLVFLVPVLFCHIGNHVYAGTIEHRFGNAIVFKLVERGMTVANSVLSASIQLAIISYSLCTRGTIVHYS